MGSCPGNTARSCGHIFPLKDLVSTVVRTTGTSNTLAAFPKCHGVVDDSLAVEIACSKQHLALMVDQRHDAIVRSQESLLAQFWTIAV